MYNTLHEFSKDTFPKSMNIKCFHCCNNFTTQPLPLPFIYEKNKFHVKYIFCSWPCMKTYVSESNLSNKNYVFSLIQQFHKTIHGTPKKIDFAPPRISLIDFGGHLTIEEFRKDNQAEYKQIEFPLIVSNPKIDKVENYSWIKEDTASTSFKNSKKNSDSEELKLERPKVVKKKNTLADAMGLLKVEN